MAVDTLPEALEQFINTSDWNDAQRMLEAHPELLSDESLALLAESIADYRLSERDQLANYLEEHRAVLQRSREVGVAAAFGEANARARQNLAERRRQMDALRPAQPTPVQKVVWQIIDADNPETLERILSEHPELSEHQDAVNYLDDLISIAERNGYEAALHILRDYHELLRGYFELPPLMLALQELTASPTWSGVRDVLHAHPELLSQESLETLDSLIAEADAQGDEPSAQALRTYRRLLEQARLVGPEEAVRELTETQGT